MLDEEQQNHVNTCQDLPERPKRDPQFFSKIITGDEKRI